MTTLYTKTITVGGDLTTLDLEQLNGYAELHEAEQEVANAMTSAELALPGNAEEAQALVNAFTKLFLRSNP